jgi:hypothetical protein
VAQNENLDFLSDLCFAVTDFGDAEDVDDFSVRVVPIVDAPIDSSNEISDSTRLLSSNADGSGWGDVDDKALFSSNNDSFDGFFNISSEGAGEI